jgi:hypothetical protein
MRRVVAVAVTGFAVAAAALPTLAAEPPVYGWWSQTNQTSAAAVPAPPDVPADGMLVQGDIVTPVAIAAVALPEDLRSAPTQLTLNLADAPVASASPVACPTDIALTGAFNGAWEDRPSYDCTEPVKGFLSVDQSQLTFDLPSRGATGWVILGGNRADRLVFERPDATALTADATSSSASPGPTATASASSSASPASPQERHADAPPSPEREQLSLPADLSADLSFVDSAPVVVDAPVQDQQGLQALTPETADAEIGSEFQPAPAPPVVRAALTQEKSPAWVLPLGLVLVFGLVLYWADGFGALPLRLHRAERDIGRRAAPPVPQQDA